MKALASYLALLGFCVQLSCQTPTILTRTNTTTATSPLATTTSAYIQIKHSSSKKLDGYWGYVDPSDSDDDGVAFQFIPDKSKATNFSIQDDQYNGPLLAGYKTGYVAGSSNAEGTPSGDTIYMSSKDFYVQGGEPMVNIAVDSATGILTLDNTLGDGTYRNLSQACFLSGTGVLDASLPVLIIGEEYFHSDNCANITLYWRLIDSDS